MLPSFLKCLFGLMLAVDPWSDEGCLLPDQTETFPSSKSNCLLSATCHLSPCVGLSALQAGECVYVCVYMVDI